MGVRRYPERQVVRPDDVIRLLVGLVPGDGHDVAVARPPAAEGTVVAAAPARLELPVTLRTSETLRRVSRQAAWPRRVAVDASGCRGDGHSPVTGSITVATAETTLAGKPPHSACSKTAASSSAMYTQ
jgi:hypothetical protein